MPQRRKEVKDLSIFNKQDVYAVATAVLYSLKDSKKYATTSELFYLLDYDNFLKLIKYFGGREIRIPTQEEISSLLKVLLLYQYYEVEHKDWLYALDKAGFEEDEALSAKTYLLHLKKVLSSMKVGRHYD